MEFALRILALFQSQLLTFTDDIDLICALTTFCESLFNFDSLLQVYQVKFCFFVFVFVLWCDCFHAGETVAWRQISAAAARAVGACARAHVAQTSARSFDEKMNEQNRDLCVQAKPLLWRQINFRRSSACSWRVQTSAIDHRKNQTQKTNIVF